MPRLVVARGKSKGQILRLTEGEEVVIGRDASNPLAIRDPQASRKHCKVWLDDDSIRLEDLGSVNGTWYRGDRIEDAKTLVEGDKFRLGGTLIFIVGDQTEEGRGRLSGRELVGYKLGDLLGRGGMGEVYEARQLSLDRDIALKVLAPELAADEEFVQKFLEEARSAGRLNHPNIVQVYDVGPLEDTYFFSMEIMARGSVEDLLREKKSLTVEEALPIIIDALRGLEYAERKGLIHRDIKPGNLMISADDVTKIGDLGIAQSADGGKASQETVSGSPHYIAPEQALGKEIDHRADLYALGVSLYEMLSGKLPFTGRSVQEIIMSAIETEAEPIEKVVPGLPAEMAAVVKDLMKKRVEERVDSASAIIQRLLPLLEQFPARGTAMIRLRADLITAGSQRLASPSPETGDAPPMPEGPSPLAELPWKAIFGVLVILTLLCSVAAIGAIVVGKARREREKRVAFVDALADRLEDADVAGLSTEAKDYAEKLDEDGYPGLARRARELAVRSEDLIESRRKAERENQAAIAWRTVARRIEVRLPKFKNDGVFLERLKTQLTEFIKKWSGTVAAGKANQELAKVERLHADWAIRKKQREAEAARLREDISGLSRRVNALSVKYRFGEALTIVSQFREGHPSRAAGLAASKIESELIAKARVFFKELEKRVNRSLYKKAFRGLREKVTSVRKLMALPLLDRDFDELLGRISETEQAHERALAAAEIRKDEERYEKVAPKVAEALAERRFDEAAREIRSVTPLLQLESLKLKLEARATVFEAAWKGLRRLVAHVKASRERSGVTSPFQLGGEELMGVAVDGNDQRLEFEVKKGVILTRAFNKMKGPELLEFFDALKLDSAGLLETACVAYAVGMEDRSRVLLGKSGGQTGELKTLAEALRRQLP